MSRTTTSVLAVIAALIAAPALAQQAPPGASVPSGGPASPSVAPGRLQKTDRGWRSSRIVGATVYNDQNESIGSVDELLIGDNHDVAAVVLSVGGILGINSKLVKVPVSEIKVTPNRLVMSGATRDKVKQMPDYQIEPAKAS